jgi:hypothetical protein
VSALTDLSNNKIGDSTVGVSAGMRRLLRRVARAVVCYRERHP